MGQAVANALSLRNDWEIHILDINSEHGARTANDLPRTTFHHANVTKYSDLAAAFQSMFQQHRKLDFVFANAGVIERTNFYSTPQAENNRDVFPPPEPDLLSIDADLKGVIFTAYLAQHYFRHSPHMGRDSSLVMTASCGGLYPSSYSPLYSAAKCESPTPLLFTVQYPLLPLPTYYCKIIWWSFDLSTITTIAQLIPRINYDFVFRSAQTTNTNITQSA